MAQPHYFFIQNPDGSRTQHFGVPPSEYQQVSSAPMNMQQPMQPMQQYGGYAGSPSPYGGAPAMAAAPYGSYPQGGLPQAQSMVATPQMQFGELLLESPGAAAEEDLIPSLVQPLLARLDEHFGSECRRLCGCYRCPLLVWDGGKKDKLDWKCLVKLSRPGWWLVHVWLYLAPTGQKYHLLSTLSFWLGLAYVLFPLNLLVYGLNDYTDVDLDAKNDRKGNFMYGAKCSAEQLRDLPRIIVILNVLPIVVLAVVSGQWLALSIWLPVCFAVNMAYNLEPLRLSSKGPFELPCVVFGFAGVTALASIVNNLAWAPFGYWAHMSCLVLRTQIWTEFLDYDPDSACGRRTTSTLLGKDLSKALVVALLALEGLVTWYFFEDFLMRLFSISGMVAFVALEIIRGTDDKARLCCTWMDYALDCELPMAQL
ncbi:unnamed protein product [Effrenium voratum]|nr:unnamed protein product [Effrenium voratum]